MAAIGVVRPDRLGLLNLVTLEGFKAQYNPERLRERVGADWQSVVVPGYSHEILYYKNTRSLELSFALKFLAVDTPQLAGLGELKRFLLSLVYPVADAVSPPDVLVIWPGTARVVVVILALEVDNEAFNLAGAVTELTVTITAKERRTYQLYSDDVRRLGSIREDA